MNYFVIFSLKIAIKNRQTKIYNTRFLVPRNDKFRNLQSSNLKSEYKIPELRSVIAQSLRFAH
jgi:hypothetical protein